jgi:hypothetical protein
MQKENRKREGDATKTKKTTMHDATPKKKSRKQNKQTEISLYYIYLSTHT